MESTSDYMWVCDPGSAWLLPSSLSIITINFLSKQNKREPRETTGTQEALETGSQLVTNRLLTEVPVISLLGGKYLTLYCDTSNEI